MIFSSNQILAISGCLCHEGELESALAFALNASGDFECLTRIKDPAKLLYQVVGNKYCIGSCFNEIPKGWKEFQFKFDIDITSRIIIQFLEEFDKKEGVWDGGYDKGFLMKCIPECLADEYKHIKSPFYGIVTFEPFTCFYSK